MSANIAICVSLLALVIAFLAIVFSIADRGRIAEQIREQTLRDLGDPTSFQVVTDGKFYRVRGPFDTFYTMKLRDRGEAELFAKQLAHFYATRDAEMERWRAAA